MWEMFSAWTELQDVFKKLPVLTAQYQVSPGKTPLITCKIISLLLSFVVLLAKPHLPLTFAGAKLFFLPTENELFDFKTTY